MTTKSDSLRPPAARVVLLGASNLTRGIAPILGTAGQLLTGPLDVMAALGHGRSYGLTSSVLGRTLPGILSSGLWDDLRQRERLPSWALVTDVGNDLAYGVEVEELMQWVCIAVDRLLAVGARVVLTQLPTESLSLLGPRRFWLLRTCLFPSLRLTLGEILGRVEVLNGQLLALGEQRQIPVIPQPLSWFGWDPIHIRRRHFVEAWPEILRAWNTAHALEQAPRDSWRERVYLRTRTPRQRSFWWLHQRRDQPCGKLRDGSLVSIY